MIEISHAYKTYPGPVHALKDVNLEIKKGEFVFLIGPSGAGKTTLFKLLSAYDKTTSGSVKVASKTVSALSSNEIPHFRRGIGVVYQDFRLLKDKTVLENVGLPLEIKGEKPKHIEAKVLEMLDSVGLVHKKNELPNHLSGGEQQRVAIARALIHRPSLLIADEPTGNLDPELGFEIMELFDRVNAQGTTVFIATHDYNIIKRKPKRIVELKDGRVV